MNDFRPEDIVRVVSGPHRNRRGVVVDHVRQLRAFDHVWQPCAISAELRRQYEAEPGSLVIRLDADFVTGARSEDVQVPIDNLRPGTRFDVGD